MTTPWSPAPRLKKRKTSRAGARCLSPSESFMQTPPMVKARAARIDSSKYISYLPFERPSVIGDGLQQAGHIVFGRAGIERDICQSRMQKQLWRMRTGSV